MHILLLVFMLLQNTSYYKLDVTHTQPKTTINNNTITITVTSPLFLPAREKFSLEILNASGLQINYSSDVRATKYTLTTHTTQPVPQQFMIKYSIVYDNMTEESNTFIYNQTSSTSTPGADNTNISALVSILIIITIVGLSYWYYKRNMNHNHIAANKTL